MANFNSQNFCNFSRQKMEEALTKEEQKHTQIILTYLHALLTGKPVQKADTPNFKMAALQAEAWKKEFMTFKSVPAFQFQKSQKESGVKPRTIVREQPAYITTTDLFIKTACEQRLYIAREYE